MAIRGIERAGLAAIIVGAGFLGKGLTSVEAGGCGEGPKTIKNTRNYLIRKDCPTVNPGIYTVDSKTQKYWIVGGPSGDGINYAKNEMLMADCDIKQTILPEGVNDFYEATAGVEFEVANPQDCDAGINK